MAGLNFQTQTIINKNVDESAKGADKTMFKGENGVLRIKRDFTFNASDVKAVRKAVGHEPTMCKAEIDFAKIPEIANASEKTYCRLDIYVGVEGAEPYLYSTPWVLKGRPFWIDFKVTPENKASIAQVIADDLKKSKTFQVGDDLLNVSVSGNKLVFEGASEFQRFRNIEINVFDMTADYSEKVASMGDSAVKLVERGVNGLGTYSQIVKDLRLPTAANTNWSALRQSEKPVLGALYNQYIIELEAESSIRGYHVVGEKNVSRTLHVFWVNNDVAEEFENALAAAGIALTSVVDAANVVSSPVSPVSELGE